MSSFLQTTIEPENISTIVEQHMAAGNDFNGAAPADATELFLPYYHNTDGIIHYKKPDETTAEGLSGGLFTFHHTQPIIIQQIYADFGASIAYTLQLQTSAGALILDTNTTRYLVKPDIRWRLAKGETLQLLTTGGTVAMWARCYARLEQALHT